MFVYMCVRRAVVDILTSVLGEMVALHHLAKSFVVCGKVKQAQKVFEVRTISRASRM